MTEISDYRTFTLDNGLRCVFRQSEKVGYCGFVVNAGSRDDGDHHGLAHFVEHTIFKGTTKRKSRHIASRMEIVGGDLNAYTTKDETTVYAAFPAGHSPRALELLADLAANSNFPADELEKERDVVADEINLYLDNPAESIFDEFEDRIYAGTPAGHNILGNTVSLKKISSEICADYRARHYVAGNMTLYCVDNCSPSAAERNINKFFGPLPTGERNMRPPILPDAKTFDGTIRREGHQAHTVLGTRIGSRKDPTKYALFLLNNHLGGPSMNSLLNRELRDKRGYVYTVDSGVNLMDGCGAFQIYFGCDPHHTKKCLGIASKLIESLAETPMKPALFDRVRKQYLGQMTVGTDNRESQAIGMGKSLLNYDTVHDYDYAKRHIMALRPEDIRAAAEKILTSGLSRLTIEPRS